MEAARLQLWIATQSVPIVLHPPTLMYVAAAASTAEADDSFSPPLPPAPAPPLLPPAPLPFSSCGPAAGRVLASSSSLPPCVLVNGGCWVRPYSTSSSVG